MALILCQLETTNFQFYGKIIQSRDRKRLKQDLNRFATWKVNVLWTTKESCIPDKHHHVSSIHLFVLLVFYPLLVYLFCMLFIICTHCTICTIYQLNIKKIVKQTPVRKHGCYTDDNNNELWDCQVIFGAASGTIKHCTCRSQMQAGNAIKGLWSPGQDRYIKLCWLRPRYLCTHFLKSAMAGLC